MSMSLKNMSNIFSLAQNILLKNKIALVPICVQYGERDEIHNDVHYINSSIDQLLFPIYFPPPDLVDWNGDFYDQAVFLKAASKKSCILASIGTTIQHLGLAVGDLFQIVAVNLEYSEVDNKVVDGKGVDYWKKTEEKLLLGSQNRCNYPSLKILKQVKPEDWTPVLSRMIDEIVQFSRWTFPNKIK